MFWSIKKFFYFLILISISTISYSEDKISNNSLNPEENDLDFIDEYLEQSKKLKTDNFQNSVVLRGLNKITAKVQILNTKINNNIHFGNLEIIPKLCWRSNPEELIENKVLLKVIETKPSGKKEEIFYGWMFSSSPAISSLEHALYDITLIECAN